MESKNIHISITFNEVGAEKMFDEVLQAFIDKYPATYISSTSSKTYQPLKPK